MEVQFKRFFYVLTLHTIFLCRGTLLFKRRKRRVVRISE